MSMHPTTAALLARDRHSEMLSAAHDRGLLRQARSGRYRRRRPIAFIAGLLMPNRTQARRQTVDQAALQPAGD